MTSRHVDVDNGFIHDGHVLERCNKWFYITRESTIEGPFATRALAGAGYETYARMAGNTFFDQASRARINKLKLEPQ